MKEMTADLKRIHETLHSTHWRWETSSARNGREKLLAFLKRKLPHIDPSSWPERFEWGGVFINGRPAEPDAVLPAEPCLVEYFEPKHSFAELATLYPPFLPEQHVLFEDRDLIVAFKPEGLPSKPSKEQKKYSLLASLERHTGRRLHMPSRLDTGTAGVIIVSKSRRAHAALQQAFEKRRIKKQYLLEVCGHVGFKNTTVDAAIDRDPRHPVLRRVVQSGGKAAVTRFRLMYHIRRAIAGEPQDLSVLMAEPLTGRTHQIRVHSASLGLPLVGDPFYGGLEDETLHLLSYRIELTHPFAAEPLRISVPDALLPSWIEASHLTR